MDINVIIHPTTYKIYFLYILFTQDKWNPLKENVCNSENRHLLVSLKIDTTCNASLNVLIMYRRKDEL